MVCAIHIRPPGKMALNIVTCCRRTITLDSSCRQVLECAGDNRQGSRASGRTTLPVPGRLRSFGSRPAIEACARRADGAPSYSGTGRCALELLGDGRVRRAGRDGIDLGQRSVRGGRYSASAILAERLFRPDRRDATGFNRGPSALSAGLRRASGAHTVDNPLASVDLTVCSALPA